jgi:hypothetical protein
MNHAVNDLVWMRVTLGVGALNRGRFQSRFTRQIRRARAPNRDLPHYCVQEPWREVAAAEGWDLTVSPPLVSRGELLGGARRMPLHLYRWRR